MPQTLKLMYISLLVFEKWLAGALETARFVFVSLPS